jgi:hypothetical protein
MRACALTVLLVTLAAVGASAQQRVSHDPVLEALVGDARGAPPEFVADALLRIAGSPKVVDREWRRQLLEEAYQGAYAAHDPYRRLALSVPPDTRQGAQSRAFDVPLTRVSLQLRIAQAMTSIDTARAREMFEWIDFNLEAGTCENALVPMVDEYYATLATLARTTFGTDTTARGDAVWFFNLYLWRAYLPTEMPAVARALRRFRPTREEALFLEGTLKWILESSMRDPRGFSSVSIDFVNRMMELEDADRELGSINWNVTRALRNYLVAQLQGPRCSDSLSDGPAVDTFNAALRRHAIRPEVIPPLGVSETRPSRLLGSARIDRYWQTLDARRLYTAGVQLRGPGKNIPTLQERQSETWRAQAERLLTDIEQWTGQREAAERDYFYQKVVLYTVLIDLVPQGTLRVRTLRSFVDYLRHADRDRDGRTLWFAFVNRLLELARSVDRRTVLDLLEESNHPVLALYARLERVLGLGNRATD